MRSNEDALQKPLARLGKDAARDPNVSFGRPFTLLLAMAMLFGIVAVLVNTRSGPGLSHDSAVYVGVANNLSEGHGFSVPFTNRSDRYTPTQAARRYGRIPLVHFPPGYPAILGAGHAVGLSTETWVRLLNALVFGLNLVLFGALANRVVGHRLWPVSIALVVLLLVGTGARSLLDYLYPWYYLHSAALSEPLFLSFVLTGLLALGTYAGTGRRAAFWALGAACALATLTRYVGVALTITSAAVVLASGRLTARRRYVDAALLSLFGVVPTALFLLVQTRAGGMSARTIGYHPPPDALRSLRNVLAGFFDITRPRILATLVAGIVILTVAGLVAGFGLVRQHRTEHTAGMTEFVVLATFTVVYVLVVWGSVTLVDASTPFDGRLLAPARAALYLLLFGGIALAGRYLRDRRTPTIGAALAVMIAVIAVPGAGAAFSVIRGSHPAPVDTAVVKRALWNIPARTFIATNAPETLYLATHRPSIIVPLERFPVTDQTNARFGEQVQELANLVRARHGLLVLWPREALTEAVPSLSQLSRLVHLRVIHTTGGIAVAEIAESPVGAAH